MVEAEGWVDIRHPVINIAEFTYRAHLTAKPGKFAASIKYFQTVIGSTKPYMSTRMVYNGGGGQIVTDGKNQLLKDQALRDSGPSLTSARWACSPRCSGTRSSGSRS